MASQEVIKDDEAGSRCEKKAVQGKSIKVVATAEFSADMSATLAEYFTAYAVNGVVTVEVTTHGLWLVNPLGGRQFLGLAKFPADFDMVN